MSPFVLVEEPGDVRNTLLYLMCVFPGDTLLRAEHGDGSVRPEERVVDVGSDPDARPRGSWVQSGEVDGGDLAVEAW